MASIAHNKQQRHNYKINSSTIFQLLAIIKSHAGANQLLMRPIYSIMQFPLITKSTLHAFTRENIRGAGLSRGPVSRPL